MAQVNPPLLRIRKLTLFTKDDVMLIGNRLVFVTSLSDFGYSEKWSAVTFKTHCHPDWIATDATKSDFEAFLASLDAGAKS